MRILTLANFLSIFIVSSSGGASIPDSMVNEGSKSIMMMLKKEPHGSDKLKSTGHFYYPLEIGANTYNMQVSSYGTVVGVISTFCGRGNLVCNVDNKYRQKTQKMGSASESFKNFDIRTKHTAF